MHRVVNNPKSRVRPGLLPLALFAMLAGAVQAAPTASYSADASGTNDNLTVSVTVNIADADLGTSGNYYLGFNHDDAWYFHNGQNWLQYPGGTIPAYAGGTLVSGTAEVVSDADLSDMIGGELYVGYGVNDTIMVANNQYSLVYTVTEETGPEPEPEPQGPAPVLLGSAANFAILAKSAVSTVPPSVIVGDVAVSPAATSFLTGFSLTAVGTTSATSPQVTGSLFGADMSPPTNSNLTVAVLDMQTAYTDAAGRPTPDYTNLGGGSLGGTTLPAGLYTWGSSVTIPTNIAISGGPNDVWIFQISGDLLMSADKSIRLEDGARARNIFWQVAGEAVIGARAHFEGNILSKTAVTMETGSSLNGRILAQTMVALDSATVTKP